MAVLKRRCPRCKHEVKVRALYIRNGSRNYIMEKVPAQYQCSVCGLCFHLRNESPRPKSRINTCKPLSRKLTLLRMYEGTTFGINNDDEVKELVTMSENEGKVE